MRKDRKQGGSRALKITSLLEQKLAEYFQTELELPGLVSISHIEAAPNMQSATVWLSVYGADPDEVLRILKSQSRNIRNYLIHSLPTKYTPEISYKIDLSEEHAQHISEIMRNLDKE